MSQVIIAGAGIGGLSLAIALRRVGLEPVVLERVATLAPVGAGIVLYPNAMKALRALGVADRVEEEGARQGLEAVRTWKGATLGEIRMDRVGAAAGAPAVGTTRAALHRTLLDALAEGDLRLGVDVVGFEQDADAVRVGTADGRTWEGALLVGADGIRSRVRSALLGPSPLRYAGYTSWRAVVPVRPSGYTAFEMWGPGQRFGAVAVSDHASYWFAVLDAPESHDYAVASKDILAQRFQDWAAPVPELIEAATEADIIRTDIHDRRPSGQWGEGRVTLLGDAAHASTPNMGQGAAMAIEDAVVLARCLQAYGVSPQALRRYEALRIPRTRRVVRESRLLGAIGHWRNPIARAVRDTFMRVTPTALLERQFGWPFGYDPASVPL